MTRRGDPHTGGGGLCLPVMASANSHPRAPPTHTSGYPTRVGWALFGGQRDSPHTPLQRENEAVGRPRSLGVGASQEEHPRVLTSNHRTQTHASHLMKVPLSPAGSQTGAPGGHQGGTEPQALKGGTEGHRTKSRKSCERLYAL